MPELLSAFLSMLASFCALPTLLTVALALRHRGAWRDWGASPLVEPGDDYRGVTATSPHVRLPRSIVAVAWSSFALGQMFLPGLMLGLYGLFAGGIGLVSIPGLIVAARCFRSGWLILRRDARAASFAEGTARWSTWLNLVLLTLAGTVTFVCVVIGQTDSLLSMASLDLYIVLSLAHAAALFKTAERLRSWSRPAVAEAPDGGEPVPVA